VIFVDTNVIMYAVGREHPLRAEARARIPTVWPVEVEDVDLARLLVDRHPGLGARDLLHVACCSRRNVTRIRTFDRGLAAALG